MTSNDESYLRWLEDPLVTLGTSLRMEIARRFRELANGQVSNVREADVPEPRSSSKGSRKNQ